MADWLEIVVPIAVPTAASAEEIGALISAEVEAAQSGTELRSTSVVFWVPAERVEEALEDTRRVARRLSAAGFAIDPDGVRAQPALPEEEWREAWKKYFHITRLTRQLVIVPSWETYRESGADDLVIDLDPGQAFGTGAHSSTQMVLLELQEARDAGFEVRRFLDIGTGSGILSIAAAKLWSAATGEAIDTDPIAVDAALENCAKNGIDERVRCSGTLVDEMANAYDLIVANIQADVLESLCDAISARVAPGGLLILSGLLSDQVDAVAARYARRPTLEIESIRGADDDTPFSCARLRRAIEDL